jgi:hypothetical protein
LLKVKKPIKKQRKITESFKGVTTGMCGGFSIYLIIYNQGKQNNSSQYEFTQTLIEAKSMARKTRAKR